MPQNSGRNRDMSIRRGFPSGGRVSRSGDSRARRRYRFSLRRMLILLVLFCVAMGFIGNHVARVKRQRAAVQKLVRAGVGVSYSRIPIQSSWESLLKRLFGRDFVRGPTDVVMINRRIESTRLEPLQQLDSLRSVDFYRSPVDDEAMRYVGRLRLLEMLDVRNSCVTDAGVRELRSLHGLSVLLLGGPKIKGATLGSLEQLPIQILDLSDSAVTDDALEHVARFQLLSELQLEGTSTTDKGLRRLSRCARLRRLWIRDTNVTAEGVQALRDALPNCWVTSDFDPRNYEARPWEH